MSAVQDFLPRMEHETAAGGVLVTVNHYHAADFQAWWFTILISATLPRHVHWVVTSGWTDSGWLTGFTHWFFPLGARLLGFTSMPAMPPDPAEVEQRARAVRHVLEYTRRAPFPVVGMAPEGRDSEGGVLQKAPPNAGRFLLLLSQHCPNILPVGIWKESGTINMKYGRPYTLTTPANLPAKERGELVEEIVMRHIAGCLPERLHGIYR